MIPAAKPPRIPVTQQGSFAQFTLRNRFPKIVSDIVESGVCSAATNDRLLGFLNEILNNYEIEAAHLAPSSAYWRSFGDEQAGRRWQELPFFDLEFCFYHGINTISGFFETGLDVFHASRRDMLQHWLQDATVRFWQPGESSPEAWLALALRQTLDANFVDASQLQLSLEPCSANSILIDQSDALIDLLLGSGCKSVHVVADNAGAELCADLVLIDGLLQIGDAEIELHLKSEPMFVSDALVLDVDETLGAMRCLPPDDERHKSAVRLENALTSNRVKVSARPDWSEPRHMNTLGPELTTSLGPPAIVLAKGDLNYRRFFEDRDWPFSTNARSASVATEGHAYALRVLKSEMVTGIPPALGERLFAEDPDWRTNSRYGLIQQVS